MRVEVAVLGSPSLIVLMASVDIKQHLRKISHESRGGRPGVSVDIKQHLKKWSLWKKSHSVTYCRAAAAPTFGVTAVYIIMLFCVLTVGAYESVFKVTVRLRQALTYIVWQQSGFELLLFLFSRALWFTNTSLFWVSNMLLFLWPVRLQF